MLGTDNIRFRSTGGGVGSNGTENRVQGTSEIGAFMYAKNLLAVMRVGNAEPGGELTSCKNPEQIPGNRRSALHAVSRNETGHISGSPVQAGRDQDRGVGKVYI